MKRFYWVSVLLVIGLGLYISTNINVHPQTQSVIPWGQYSTPEDLGQEIYKKFQNQIKESPIVLLGVVPNKIEDIELWRGFLEAAENSNLKFETILVDPQLPYVEMFPSALHMDLKEEMTRFAEGVKHAQVKGLHLAIIVPTIYSSQLLKRNPVNRLIQEFQISALSFSVTGFPVTREQAEVFEPKCVVEEGRDLEGTGALGCAIQNIAFGTYRKKIEDNKFSGLVEQVSAQDYLILLNRNPVAH